MNGSPLHALRFPLLFWMVALNVSAQPYLNYAAGKPVSLDFASDQAGRITDGSLVSGAVRFPSDGEDHRFEIDLTADFKLSGLHVYLDPADAFSPPTWEVAYQQEGRWHDIPDVRLMASFPSCLEMRFPHLVSATALRLTAAGTASLGMVEIQAWGRDFPVAPHDVVRQEPVPFAPSRHWVCVNQIAYNLGAPKGFTVPTASTNLPFVIKERGSGRVAFTGRLHRGKGDFTAFDPVDSAGRQYVIQVAGDGLEGESFPFEIGRHALQRLAYPSMVAFFNDVRSMVGSHPSAYGGTAWRDGCYYTHEVPSLVLLYLSNPTHFDAMPVTLDWPEDQRRILSPDFSPTREPHDQDALATVRTYYRDFPAPLHPAVPDIIECIRFGTAWNLIDPVSADPSGDPAGERMHAQTIEQFAYFLYGYPAFAQHVDEDFYRQVLAATVDWWRQAGLFEVITVIGGPKGRDCPGHSILPNLLMHEVARREGHAQAPAYLEAARAQTAWIMSHLDWTDSTFGKGQRISEHKLITGLAHFQHRYPQLAPAGLPELLLAWAENVVAMSDNAWDFRKFSAPSWTLPGFNEVGNVVAFPACALAVAAVLPAGALRDRVVELAYAHYDNFNGRNPQNAHCANHPDLGFAGVERGWPHGDPRRDVCARLEQVRGSLSSLPGSEMYPFNPHGRPRHGEGWTVYNANWNLSVAYLNRHEGVGDPFHVIRP